MNVIFDNKDLNVVIVDDMEGISGIYDWHQILYGYEEFEEFGRIQITEDVNAAIRGLRDAGAIEIRVIDAHGSGGPSKNIIPEKLEMGVKLFQEPDFLSRFKNALDETVSAAVLIGFHAMADTKDGFLSHTITFEPRIKINGKLVGETALAAITVAEYDISVIMASGDQALVREASALLPGIETVQVKTSTDRRTTECLPLSEARRLIEEAAVRALSRIDEFKPLEIKKPINVEISYSTKEHADLAGIIPRCRRSNSTTISYIAEDWMEANSFIMTANSLATQLRMRPLMQELSKLEKFKEISKDYNKKLLEEWASQ